MAAYGAVRLPERLGMRRAGPGPERPLKFPDPDFLLVLMRSSRVISRPADMVACGDFIRSNEQ